MIIRFSRRNQNVLKLKAFSHTSRSHKHHNSPNVPPIENNLQSLLKFMKRHLLNAYSKWLNVFCLCYRRNSHFLFLFLCKFPAIYAFRLCVKFDKANLTLINYIMDSWVNILVQRYQFYWFVKNAHFNYPNFDLEGGLDGGLPYTWYVSSKSIITLLKLIWWELEKTVMSYGK